MYKHLIAFLVTFILVNVFSPYVNGQDRNQQNVELNTGQTDPQSKEFKINAPESYRVEHRDDFKVQFNEEQLKLIDNEILRQRDIIINNLPDRFQTLDNIGQLNIGFSPQQYNPQKGISTDTVFNTWLNSIANNLLQLVKSLFKEGQYNEYLKTEDEKCESIYDKIDFRIGVLMSYNDFIRGGPINGR